MPSQQYRIRKHPLHKFLFSFWVCLTALRLYLSNWICSKYWLQFPLRAEGRVNSLRNLSVIATECCYNTKVVLQVLAAQHTGFAISPILRCKVVGARHCNTYIYALLRAFRCCPSSVSRALCRHSRV